MAQSSGFDRFPVVFDINLHYEDAMNRLQYLVDGHYIDNATDSIDVQLLTFNGEAHRLVQRLLCPRACPQRLARLPTGWEYCASFLSLLLYSNLAEFNPC